MAASAGTVLAVFLSIEEDSMRITRNTLSFLLGALCFAGTVLAQGAYGEPDYGSPDDDDIRQTVARLAYVSGDVSFARGDDPDAWQPANPNIPMTLGDRVWTSGGRLEVQVHGGNVIRLAKSTDLTALNLTEDTQQFSVSAGVASFQIRRLGENDVFEVDTPNAAITFERAGEYRIDVRESETRLQVRRGQAVVASGGGQVPLGAGQAILIEGEEPPRYDMVGIAAPDGWDRWVASRGTRYANVRSYQYVSPDIAGVEDLDRNGSWQQVPNYGWCWTPRGVPAGWQPYRAGRWIWQDPWGWTWVSTERWGWAPYHYGRWVTWNAGWFWVPVAPRATVVAYSPALVAFVGGGPGFSVAVGSGGTDYIGWFPLAPREPVNPWWGRPAVNVNVTNVTNVTYINRTYVTVVNQQTFVSSRVVTNNYVRDQSIVTRVERAPVVRGAVPIVPTNESIRVAARQAPAVRPPTAVASRSVVTRSAPPPAPPRFDQKVAVIRENKGRPVTAAEATTLSAKDNRAMQPVRAVRPAAADAGRVTLAPKTQTSASAKPEPVAPNRGRPLATREQPVAAAPPASARPAPRPAVQEPSAVEPTQRPRPTVQQRPQAPQPATKASPVSPREQVSPREGMGRPAERPTARPAPPAQRPQPENRPQSPGRPPTAAPAQQPQPENRPQSPDGPATSAPAQKNEPRPASRPTPRAPAPTHAQPEHPQPRAGAPRVTPEAHSARPAPPAAASEPNRAQPQPARPVPTRTPKSDDKGNES
jgi:FecR protein